MTDRGCEVQHGNRPKETEGHFYYVDMDAKSYPNPATGAAETETKNVRCVRDIKMSID